MRYCDRILTLKEDNADNALYLGIALHTGLEKGVESAIQEYYSHYPIITDAHINEVLKLESVIPKTRKLIPDGEFEVKIEDDDFIGYIDLLTPSKGFREEIIPNTYDLYDFKYSNNVKNYMNSTQLHLYKYFFEKLNPGKKIRNLYYLFAPKVQIKQKKTEDLSQFRLRIKKELKKVEPQLIHIEYKQEKVIEWMFSVKKVIEADTFNKTQSWLCRYCEYQKYCETGEDYMLLPKNERRNIEKIEKKVVWLYGAPFSGKTTFANQFPDPLMLNTDGNIKFVDAPYLAIKDQVKVEGRRTIRTLAWEVFKESISELEKKENDFKTIVVDLLEDTYEYCRLYMYDQMGITHESDDSFKAWDKVRTEFLSTLKRLMNLDYENIIIISHEDTSKDIMKKGGDKVTAIKPNLQEKAANKIAGMVDIVARVIADGDNRVLSFKTNEVIFGGGRLVTQTNEIPLDYSTFLEIYEEANKVAVENLKPETKLEEPKKPSKAKRTKKTVEKPVEESPVEVKEEVVSKEVNEDLTTEEKADEVQVQEEPIEDKPKKRTRKKRSE